MSISEKNESVNTGRLEKKLKKIIFEGVGTAMVTPMYEDGKINYHVFKQLLEMQIEKKADAVIIAGSTGEGSTLSDEEQYYTCGICGKNSSWKDSGNCRRRK